MIIPASIRNSADHQIDEPSYEMTDWGIQPVIEGEDSDGETITFEPAVVTKVDGILPWNVEQDTSLCGESRVAQNGDNNLRATIEGVIFKSQLETLARLRNNSEEVALLTSMTRELGIPTVTFDRLQITRNADVSHGTFTHNGETVKEPMYEFQLQSKENENSA